MNKLTGSVKAIKEVTGILNTPLSITATILSAPLPITANIIARGPQGAPGEKVTYENVVNAIGYVPVNEERTLQENDINLLF